MFAYNPQVTDRSGEIYAEGSNNASAILARGTENMTNSLTSSFNTAMGMVNKNMEKSQENRVASDSANAKFDMLKGMKKTDNTPLFTQDTIDKFDTMPLGKRQAYVQTAEAVMDDDLKKWMYQQQYNAQNNRITQAQLQNQVPANQVPMSTNAPAAQPSAGPNVNWNVVR
jgi:hypothetical protein